MISREIIIYSVRLIFWITSADRCLFDFYFYLLWKQIENQFYFYKHEVNTIRCIYCKVSHATKIIYDTRQFAQKKVITNNSLLQ